MSEFILDVRGEQCPAPVIKTRKALEEHKECRAFTVLVGDENAAQNVRRMAKNRGCEAEIEADAEGKLSVRISVTEGAVPEQPLQEAELACALPAAGSGVVVAVGSGTMGEGNDELGRLLIKGFIYALSQQETPPQTLLFYNGGAHLTCEGSPALEDIRALAEQGAEVLTCGTCLDFYGLKEKLAVGQVTNMYVIAEKMLQASHVVKP